MNDEQTAELRGEDHPVEPPTAPTHAPPFAADVRQFWAGTGAGAPQEPDATLPSHAVPNNRAGSHNLRTLRTLLSDRDLEILEFVYEHRIVTTRQIQRMLFALHATTDAGTRACNRVLTRLREKRFLHRLERPVGGVRGGSGAFAWMLGAAGDRAIRDSLSLDGPRQRLFDPTPLHLNHTLAVTEVRVAAVEAARRGDFELVAVETEPACWRDYVGPSGVSVTLKPDLFVRTAAGEFEDYWFLEIDRGTESLPTLIRKCLAYERHRSSGREQASTGVYPRVVWLIAEPRRRLALKRALAADSRVRSDLFVVVDPLDLINLLRHPESDW